MVLRTGYFQLLDYERVDKPDIDDIVTEISQEEYEKGKASCRPKLFICADKVVFDAKGMATCNESM